MNQTHIVVADKDPNICELVRTRLSNRGFRVSAVETTEELLRLLDHDPPELVLVSSDMDRRSGARHPVEKIREKPHLSSVPVILLTQDSEIAELILGQDRGFDDFLTKPFSPLILQLRVALNMSRARLRSDANALTHLPGNSAIEKVIQSKIEKGLKFSVLYIDINQFKAFNDRYGFKKGDDVLKQTAKLLMQTRPTAGGDDCFIGHIGGDDFIVVLGPEYEEGFARAFLHEFDRIISSYYSEADRKRGYVRMANRRGKRENIPLMSCSVAACNNLHRPYQNLGEIARDAAEVKSFLKSQPGSHYLRDRRSEPIAQLEEAVEILAPEVEALDPKRKDIEPLGRILVNAGLLDEAQLETAMKRHLETGQRLGQTLISMNLVSSSDVGRMLEKKLHVPYVSLRSVRVPRETLRLFTADFMRSHRVVPLEISGERIKLAMCDPFDLKTLDAIERVSQMKPSPCLALEDEFEAFIEAYAASGMDHARTGSEF